MNATMVIFCYFLFLTVLGAMSEVNSAYSERSGKIVNLFDSKPFQPPFPATETFENEVERSDKAKNAKFVEELAESVNALENRDVIVLLVDAEDAHRESEALINEILNLSYQDVNFGLMKFNGTGVTPVLADTLSNKGLFLRRLKWKDNTGEPKTSMTLGPYVTKGAVAFFAILKAARTLPKSSGIIVFVDRKVEDEDLAQLAVRELLEKRIKLYVIWMAPFPNLGYRAKLLKEAALLTGGRFYVAKTNTIPSTLCLYCEDPNEIRNEALVAFYNNITGSRRIYFPINADTKGIHMGVTCRATPLKLISPGGDYALDLTNDTEIELFSVGSFVIPGTEPGQYEILLNAEGKVPTPVAGVWRLDVGAAAQNCNATVSVRTRLNVTTYVTGTCEGSHQMVSSKTKKVLRVFVAGDLRSIENVSLVNQQGLPIKLNQAEMNSTKREIDIELNSLPNEPFYLRISGEDKQGETFSRLSYFDREKINYAFQPITVEVGAGSELLVSANQQAKIYFEVTNNRDQPTYVYFQVQDERSLLARMEPRSSSLNPKQTVIVTVTTYIPSTPGTNFRDLITFTVYGPERVQKSAAMYVGANRIIDNEEPRMTHRYSSDCTSILIGDCQDGTWVIEVTAEDRESGLLQLTSNPKGLYFPNSFVAGTKEPVVGIYGGSCCQSKIQLTAIDMLNNRRTYTADAYFATLSAGSIAAIVLGLILFIIVVVALVILCRTKCCKKKESVDLPTYRSPHGNTQSRY